MARTLALLFAAGASLSLMLFLVLPHPEANVTGMLATIARHVRGHGLGGRTRASGSRPARTRGWSRSARC